MSKAIDGQKRCPKCRQIKPVGDFWTDRKQNDGLSLRCKPCKSASNKDLYERDKERILAHNEAYRQRNLEESRIVHNAAWHRTRFEDPGDWIRLDVLYERDGGICKICEQPCKWEESSLDHKTPKSKGGTHTWTNVQLAHLQCNNRKQDTVL